MRERERYDFPGPRTFASPPSFLHVPIRRMRKTRYDLSDFSPSLSLPGKKPREKGGGEKRSTKNLATCIDRFDRPLLVVPERRNKK